MEKNSRLARIKGLRRHYNADLVTKTSLSFPEHQSPSGLCSICTGCGRCEVGLKAKTGKTQYPEPFGIAQFGAEKRLPNLKDLQIIPEIFGRGIFFPKVDTKVEMGGFKCNSPISIAALGSTRVASGGSKLMGGKLLSEGAAKAGIVRVIGENVYASFGKEGLKELITSYVSNQGKYGAIVVQVNCVEQKLGVAEMAVELGANAIELKYGQGAKQGLGGEIQFKGEKEAERYKKLGYMILEGEFYERHVHPGDIIKKELRKTLIKYSDLGVPLWIKIAMGKGIIRFLKECQQIKKEENVPLECITVDGYEGGTGMSPWLIMNESGLPSAALFKDLPKFDYDILLAGGFNTGADVAKGMMLGADGVAMGRAMIIAVKTNGAEGIVNFVKAINQELQMLTTILRGKKVSEIKNRRENLLALTREASEMFGITNEVKEIL